MRLLPLILLVISVGVLRAQPKQNSPYSRYGLGDPVNQYFAVQAGVGGLTAASHDPFHLNLENPASYAFLRTTVLETGLTAKNSYYQSDKTKQNAWSGNLSYFALGFTLRSPINEILDKNRRKWQFGMGLSLTPYTQVGYDIETADFINGQPGLGKVNNRYEGSGGTYRLQWSNAARYKNTAFGINTGWNFGKLSYENTTAFVSDSFPTFRNHFRDEFSLNGFTWRAGFQHDFNLKYVDGDRDIPSKWISVGLTGEGRHNLKTTANVFRIRSRGRNDNGTYTNADTLLFKEGDKQTLTLPAAFSAGIQYVKANKFKLGAQFGMETWADYNNPVRPETLRSTFSISAGFEYIPDFLSYNRYMRRARYRLGAYYRQDPRIVNGKELDDVGVSLGLGLPLILPRQQTSFINAALEIGRLGADSPIRETYLRLTLGFTLNDNSWFYQRRFE